MGTAGKPGLSDNRAARFLVALRKGTTPHLFGVKLRCIEAYCAIHPEYAREARPLIEANAKAARLRKGDRLRSTTHCRAGLHLMTGDNVFIDGTHGRRRCLACRRASTAKVPEMRPEVAKQVEELLRRGTPSSRFTKPGSSYLIQHKTFTRFRLENPHIDKLVSINRIDAVSRGLRLRRLRDKNEAMREQNNDFFRIRAMLPSNLPADIREDVVQSVFVALLEGSLQRDQVKERLPEFVAAYNRDAGKHGVGKYGLRSIDAPAYADGAMSFGDTISRGLWD